MIEKELILILNDHLKKNNYNHYIIAREIIENKVKDYGTHNERILQIQNLYLENKFSSELDKTIIIDDFSKMFLKNTFFLTKKKILDLSIDGKITYLIFEYLKKKEKVNINISYLINASTLTRLDYLGVDYNIVIEKENKTLEVLGKEYGVTRERMRQKLLVIENTLREENIDFVKKYLFYEELSLLPKYKQAIILSKKDIYYNSTFNLFSFSYKIDDMLNYFLEEFKLAEKNNYSRINDIFSYSIEAKKIFERFVYQTKYLYISNDKIFSNRKNNVMHKLNYLINYLEDERITNFEITKKFINDFSLTKHGVLYNSTHTKVTIKSIESLLDSNSKVFKLAKNKYIIASEIEETLLNNKAYLYHKIEENIPFSGQKDIADVFEKDFQKININKESIFFILKELFHEDFNFFKFNINSMQLENINYLEKTKENLENIGISDIPNVSNCSYLNKKLLQFFSNEELLYSRKKYYLLNKDIFEDYYIFEKIIVEEFIEGIILKKDILYNISNEILKKYGETTSYRIWSKIHGYTTTTLFSTKNPNNKSISDLLKLYFSNKNEVRKKEITNFLEKIIASKTINIYYYFDYLENNKIIYSLDNDNYKINNNI